MLLFDQIIIGDLKFKMDIYKVRSKLPKAFTRCTYFLYYTGRRVIRLNINTSNISHMGQPFEPIFSLSLSLSLSLRSER
jgi:hypothetical protein